jgi:hypothetical protein
MIEQVARLKGQFLSAQPSDPEPARVATVVPRKKYKPRKSGNKTGAAAYIRDLVSRGPANFTTSTMKELGAKQGFGESAVQSILNKLVREGVIRRTAEKGVFQRAFMTNPADVTRAVLGQEPRDGEEAQH